MLSKPIPVQEFKNKIDKIISNSKAMSMQIGGSLCVFTHDGNGVKINTPSDMEHQQLLTMLLSKMIDDFDLIKSDNGIFFLIRKTNDGSDF